MEDIRAKIKMLEEAIQVLSRQQADANRQLLSLTKELDKLKAATSTTDTVPIPKKEDTGVTVSMPVKQETAPPKPASPAPAKVATPPRQPVGLEAFIGENLAGKIGILVMIIGVFIGAKYAIDRDLVSPAMRTVAGYITGLTLIGFAVRLRTRYAAYSAVLMGGGLSVLYFMTYLAYSFYSLLPQLPAFGLMLVITVATVWAAIVYNRVIIAHLALVGAYAIPFLLSNNQAQYGVFFSYIALINAGILVIAFRRYWKSLYRLAFLFTWIIFGTWCVVRYEPAWHFNLAIGFAIVYFLLFYATFLAYKLVKKEQYHISDVMILLSNAFVFYGTVYALLDNYGSFDQFTGLFTVLNALLHLIVGVTIRRLKLADRSVFYLILGLAVVFLTIAVPVQLDGDWVTLLWAGEALVVFLIGRTQQNGAYEKLGVGLCILSVLSLCQDRFEVAVLGLPGYVVPVPFLNSTFFTGLLVASMQGVMLWFLHHKKEKSVLKPGGFFQSFYHAALPVIFLAISYVLFDTEIRNAFQRLFSALRERGVEANDLFVIAAACYLLYAMVFVTIVLLINHYRIHNRSLAVATLAGIGVIVLILCIQLLPQLDQLTALYKKGTAYYGVGNLTIRYFLMAGMLWLLYAADRLVLKLLPNADLKLLCQVVSALVLLALVSAEYLHWVTMAGSGREYKLGLSILWGIYALLLVGYGIYKQQKHLRLTGICLFLVTLVKLLFYDLAAAGTLTRTLSFVSLGVLLLLVSYLYNRYKDRLKGGE